MENTFRKTYIQRVVDSLLKYQRLYSAAFVLLFVFSFFSSGWTNVVEDATAFLPQESQSREAIRLEETEFVSFGTAEVCGEHMSDADAARLIAEVTSLGNVAYSSREVTPSADGWGCSPYVFLSFRSTADAPESYATVQQIKDIAAGYSGTYVYSSLLESTAASHQAQLRSVVKITALCVLGILLLTTQSFAEILILLISFLVSAVIQKGTNFAFGTISALSDTLSLLLQLVMTSAYFLMFLTRYWDAHKTRDIPESVRQGLSSAAPEILTSAFTTAAALVTMLCMHIAIGQELGLVLLKAVLISLLNVFLLTPTLVLLCGKLLDKTHHRRILPIGLPMGKFVGFTRIVFPVIFLFALYVGFSMAPHVNVTYDSAHVSDRSATENELAYSKLLAAQKANRIELIFPSGDYEKERELTATLSAWNGVTDVTSVAGIRVRDTLDLTEEVGFRDIMELTGMDEIASKAVLAMYAARNSEYETVLRDVASYRAPLLDVLLCLHDNLHATTLNLTQEQINAFEELYTHFNRLCEELRGSNYSRVFIRLTLPMEGQTTVETINSIRSYVNSLYGDNTFVGGRSVMFMEFLQTYGRDKTPAMVIGLVLVLLVLLISFRSLSLPILLAVVMQGGILLDLAVKAYVGTTMYFMVPLVVNSVLLGTALSYAIVLTKRYSEARGTTPDRRLAMTEALRAALPVAVPSCAIAVVSGYFLSGTAGLGTAAGVGQPMAMGMLISFVLLLLVLPQSLYLFDGLIVRTSLARVLGWSPEKAAKVRKSIMGWVMTFVGIISILLSFVLWIASNNLHSEKLNGYTNDIITIEALVPKAEEYEALILELQDSSLDFAQRLLTDQMGSALVDQDESSLSQGKGSLDRKKKEYEENSRQYQESLEQYETGKALYEEASANYERSLGEYNARMAAYEQAKAQLEMIEPVYNRVIGPYNDYMKIQAEYDEAVAEGNTQKAARLYMTVQTQKALYDSVITASGYSISMLVAEYEASEHDLSMTEQELSAAKQTLDETKLQLEQGKAALEAGKEALAQTGIDLEQDYEKIQEDMEQYESDMAGLGEVKDQLNENSEELAQNIEKLARANDLNKELSETVESLYSFEAVRKRISPNANSTEIFAVVLEYCRDQIVASESKWTGLMAAMGALFLSGILTFMVGGTSLIRRRTRAQNTVSIIAAVFALATIFLWIVFGTEWSALVISAGVALFVSSVCSVALYKSGKFEE